MLCRRIFSTLGVPWLVVAGDTGQMGGTASHEYHYPAQVGQDRLAVCTSCGAGSNTELGLGERCTECGGETQQTRGIEVNCLLSF